MTKKWQLAKKAPQELKDKFPELTPVVLQLLYNRDLKTQEQIDEFLNPDYSQDLHDPFLFKDMEKAVERIFQARDKREKICVHGDYDGDGITATAVMTTALKNIGFKDENLSIYIPHRMTEGYGINPKTIKYLVKEKVDLIITVDCGISNKKEITDAVEAGLDVIITDHHHEPLERPDKALAIINPSLKDSGYPFPYLSGCGVAFKVSQALFAKAKKEKPDINWEAKEKWIMDLVAIGTVGDIMPLLGENRTLVKYGLVVLQKTKRVGLQQLIAKAGSEGELLDTYHIGFQIVPRLNAAGRLEHGNVSYSLLMTDSETEAKKLAVKLDQTNSKRQKLTEKITKEAKKKLGQITDDQFLLITSGEDWPMGIVGLVAGRIAEEYNRPTMIISENKEGIIGSGRSIPKFNMIEAVQQADKLLKKFGGHAQACGFELKDKKSLKAFQDQMESIAKKQLKPAELQPMLEIDAELPIDQANWELFSALEQFPPYGEEAQDPKFVSKKVKITEIKTVGKNNDHLKFKVEAGQTKRQVIGFRFGDWAKKLDVGDEIDLVYNLTINEWNGRRDLELKAVDLRKS